MALFPAAILAIFAFFCGSFAGAASFPAGPVGYLLVLAMALGAAAAWRDPLALGRSGRFLLGALLVAVGASLLASPVPRAGRVALVLLPGWLLVPAFVARCWSTPRRRELGVAAVAAVAGGVAIWAIVDQHRHALDRAAMPLGHHNLLAAFLVVLAPLAALALRSPGPGRWIAVPAVVAVIVALVATRSFLNGAVLAAVALLGARRIDRARHLVYGLALVALALLAPRGVAIFEGEDSSAAARATYWAAAWNGFLERPILGWGPGSTPWTLAETMRPIPGVNPAGEIVGEAHSLPLQLLRELGGTGLLFLLGLIGLWLWRRIGDRAAAFDRDAVDAGLLSTLAAFGSGIGGAWLAVPALPLALATGVGLTLAGLRSGAPEPAPAAARAGAWPVWIYVGAAAFALLPIARAQAAYERAARAPQRALAAPEIAEAMRLDPDFPLYRARWAWTGEAPAARRSVESIAAARTARGVAALSLRAGVEALEAGDREAAGESFARALALDPLSAFAAFQLAPLARDPSGCMARAFAAEPRLAGATFFRGSESARRAAIQRLATWPGIDAGWRASFLETAVEAIPEEQSEVDLSARIDSTPALSMSLHVFRRSPWPADLARIRVERDAVRKLRALPSAAALDTSSPEAFPKDRCAP